MITAISQLEVITIQYVENSLPVDDQQISAVSDGSSATSCPRSCLKRLADVSLTPIYH